MLFPEHVRPFEHKQFVEQNPDKRPEFVGHLKYKSWIFKIKFQIYKMINLHVAFWQTKLPEQEQLDEQNPPKEPELAGHLDASIKKFMHWVLEMKTFYLHVVFWHSNPPKQVHNDEQKPPKDLEIVGQLIWINEKLINIWSIKI